MKVLFVIDNAKRDSLAMFYLINVLTKAYPSHVFDWVSMVGHMKVVGLVKPDLLVVPRGDIPVLKKLNHRQMAVIIPSEGARMTKETMYSVFVGRGHGNQIGITQTGEVFSEDYIASVMCWGKSSAAFVERLGLIAKEKIMVCGNPRFAIYQSKSFGGRLARKDRNRNITIGVAISAKNIAPFQRINYIETLDKFRTLSLPLVREGGKWFDYTYVDYLIVDSMLRALAELDDRFQIVLRVGPLEDVNYYRFLEERYRNLRIIETQEAHEFVATCDLLLTCWSTLGLEFLAAGKPVVSMYQRMGGESLSQYLDPDANGFNQYLPFYEQYKNDNELMPIIKKLTGRNYSISGEAKRWLDDNLGIDENIMMRYKDGFARILMDRKDSRFPARLYFSITVKILRFIFKIKAFFTLKSSVYDFYIPNARSATLAKRLE